MPNTAETPLDNAQLRQLLSDIEENTEVERQQRADQFFTEIEGRLEPLTLADATPEARQAALSVAQNIASLDRDTLSLMVRNLRDQKYNDLWSYTALAVLKGFMDENETSSGVNANEFFGFVARIRLADKKLIQQIPLYALKLRSLNHGNLLPNFSNLHALKADNPAISDMVQSEAKYLGEAFSSDLLAQSATGQGPVSPRDLLLNFARSYNFAIEILGNDVLRHELGADGCLNILNFYIENFRNNSDLVSTADQAPALANLEVITRLCLNEIPIHEIIQLTQPAQMAASANVPIAALHAVLCGDIGNQGTAQYQRSEAAKKTVQEIIFKYCSEVLLEKLEQLKNPSLSAVQASEISSEILELAGSNEVLNNITEKQAQYLIGYLINLNVISHLPRIAVRELFALMDSWGGAGQQHLTDILNRYLTFLITPVDRQDQKVIAILVGLVINLLTKIKLDRPGLEALAACLIKPILIDRLSIEDIQTLLSNLTPELLAQTQLAYLSLLSNQETTDQKLIEKLVAVVMNIPSDDFLKLINQLPIDQQPQLLLRMLQNEPKATIDLLVNFAATNQNRNLLFQLLQQVQTHPETAELFTQEQLQRIAGLGVQYAVALVDIPIFRERLGGDLAVQRLVDDYVDQDFDPNTLQQDRAALVKLAVDAYNGNDEADLNAFLQRLEKQGQFSLTRQTPAEHLIRTAAFADVSAFGAESAVRQGNRAAIRENLFPNVLLGKLARVVSLENEIHTAETEGRDPFHLTRERLNPELEQRARDLENISNSPALTDLFAGTEEHERLYRMGSISEYGLNYYLSKFEVLSHLSVTALGNYMRVFEGNERRELLSEIFARVNLNNLAEDVRNELLGYVRELENIDDIVLLLNKASEDNADLLLTDTAGLTAKQKGEIFEKMTHEGEENSNAAFFISKHPEIYREFGHNEHREQINAYFEMFKSALSCFGLALSEAEREQFETDCSQCLTTTDPAELLDIEQRLIDNVNGILLASNTGVTERDLLQIDRDNPTTSARIDALFDSLHDRVNHYLPQSPDNQKIIADQQSKEKLQRFVARVERGFRQFTQTKTPLDVILAELRIAGAPGQIEELTTWASQLHGGQFSTTIFLLRCRDLLDHAFAERNNPNSKIREGAHATMNLAMNAMSNLLEKQSGRNHLLWLLPPNLMRTTVKEGQTSIRLDGWITAAMSAHIKEQEPRTPDDPNSASAIMRDHGSAIIADEMSRLNAMLNRLQSQPDCRENAETLLAVSNNLYIRHCANRAVGSISFDRKYFLINLVRNLQKQDERAPDSTVSPQNLLRNIALSGPRETEFGNLPKTRKLTEEGEQVLRQEREQKLETIKELLRQDFMGRPEYEKYRQELLDAAQTLCEQLDKAFFWFRFKYDSCPHGRTIWGKIGRSINSSLAAENSEQYCAGVQTRAEAGRKQSPDLQASLQSLGVTELSAMTAASTSHLGGGSTTEHLMVELRSSPDNKDTPVEAQSPGEAKDDQFSNPALSNNNSHDGINHLDLPAIEA